MEPIKEAEIRKLLVISTAHVPADLRVLADEHEDTSEWNAVVHVLDVGFLLWVPDDPKDSSENGQAEEPHPAILAIQLYARELGCDYVMIDRDAEQVATLPVFEEDEEDEDGQLSSVAAAVARDADDASSEELEAADSILSRLERNR